MRKIRIIAMVSMIALVISLISGFVFAEDFVIIEVEPNNSVSEAYQTWFPYFIYSELKLIGSLNQANDSEDWYVVRAAINNNNRFLINTLRFDGTQNCTYQFTAYDTNLNIVGQMTSTGENSLSLNNFLMMIEQSYYFQVKLISGSPNKPYLISLNLQNVYSALSEIKDELIIKELMEINGIDIDGNILEETFQ